MVPPILPYPVETGSGGEPGDAAEAPGAGPADAAEGPNASPPAAGEASSGPEADVYDEPLERDLGSDSFWGEQVQSGLRLWSAGLVCACTSLPPAPSFSSHHPPEQHLVFQDSEPESSDEGWLSGLSDFFGDDGDGEGW